MKYDYRNILQVISDNEMEGVSTLTRLQKRWPELYNGELTGPLDDAVLVGMAADDDEHDIGWDVWDGDPQCPGVRAPGCIGDDPNDPSGWLQYAAYTAYRAFLATIRAMRKEGYGVTKVGDNWMTYRLSDDESRARCGPQYSIYFVFPSTEELQGRNQ